MKTLDFPSACLESLFYSQLLGVISKIAWRNRQQNAKISTTERQDIDNRTPRYRQQNAKISTTERQDIDNISWRNFKNCLA